MNKVIPELPFEILRNVFEHLTRNRDLLQCQLTCRQWYQASTEQLYESVYIGSETTSNSFIHTIITSQVLGKYTKKMNLPGMRRDNLTLDYRETLLEHVIRFCPNIAEITASNLRGTFWHKLTDAGNHNKLRLLVSLPQPDNGDSIGYYVDTALAFRITLKKLLLCDQTSLTRSTNKIYLRDYERLSQRLKEFLYLEDLTIICYAKKDLFELDSVVQDCSALKSLHINIFPSVNSINSNAVNSFLSEDTLCSIQPQPNVKAFRRNWEIMNNNSSISYFMYKFPKLEALHFRSILLQIAQQQSYNVSAKFMHDFFKYMSNIPTVQVNCVFKKDDLIDVWVNFIKNSSKRQAAVGINYIGRNDLRPTYNQGLFATICFPPESCTTAMPHIELIERAGYVIHKLEISNVQNIQSPIFRRREDEDMNGMVNGYWLDHVLQNCPSLKDLTINQPGRILLCNSKIKKHASVKRLVISHLYTEAGDTILTDLSICLPALKYLHLDCYGENNKITKIDMPYSSLDTLTWTKKSKMHDNDDEVWQF